MLVQVNGLPPGRDYPELKKVRREAFGFTIIMSNTPKNLSFVISLSRAICEFLVQVL